MNAETWERLKDAYAAAIELPPAEGKRLIEETFADDESTRQEALAMLAAAARGPHFLDQPALQINRLEQIAAAPELSPGTIINERFRIDDAIAEGGMGRVYSATDLELKRRIAVKAVHARPRVADRLRALLRQEAQVISQLNHPGICILHDVRQQDGFDYLIMEFVDGETLAERLSRKPLSLAESIRIAVDLLAALDYAHRQGVIHRDLKPSNVMLTRSGAKLLDFGIAKLKGYDEPDGIAAGTPMYMAPEQISQSAPDVRSDIYSFGVVLATLLTGSLPSSDPAQRNAGLSSIPSPLQQIVIKCLAEDPADRWQDAGDLRCAIELASAEPLELAAQRRNLRRLKRLSASLALVTIIAIAGFSLAWMAARRVPPAARIELLVMPPEGTDFLPIENAGPAVISPDGRNVVFVARQGEIQKLWLRPIGSSVPEPLENTETASHPFWSPDSKSIAFFSAKLLRKIELRSGKVETVCNIETGRGGTWNQFGDIVFSSDYTDALMRVSAKGGTPVPFTQLDAATENSHRWPVFLPDGKHVLFVIRAQSREHRGLFLASLTDGTPRRIGQIESSVAYARRQDGPDYLLFVQDSKIVALTFDRRAHTLGNDAVTVAELNVVDESTSRAPVSVSDTGILVYGGGRPEKSRLVWYDSLGKETSSQTFPWRTRFLRLSADSESAALERIDIRFGTGSIFHQRWNPPKLATLTDAVMSTFAPVWRPSGSGLAFSVDQDGAFNLVASSTDGVAPRILLKRDEMITPTDWFDQSLVYEITLPSKAKSVSTGKEPVQRDLQLIDFADSARTVPLLTSDADERLGRISPDGKWLAYTSDHTTVEQVYVRPFRSEGRAIRVSVTGGTQPVWNHDSTGIYFLSTDPDDRRLFESRLNLTTLKAETPKGILPIPKPPKPGRADGWEYDVAADGRILVTLPNSVSESRAVTVVQNWLAPR